MPKSAGLAFLLLGLLLCASSTQAARHLPADSTKETAQPVAGSEVPTEAEMETCGDDECISRRTLAAHLDYIYTQEKNN